MEHRGGGWLSCTRRTAGGPYPHGSAWGTRWRRLRGAQAGRHGLAAMITPGGSDRPAAVSRGPPAHPIRHSPFGACPVSFADTPKRRKCRGNTSGGPQAVCRLLWLKVEQCPVTHSEKPLQINPVRRWQERARLVTETSLLHRCGSEHVLPTATRSSQLGHAGCRSPTRPRWPKKSELNVSTRSLLYARVCKRSSDCTCARTTPCDRNAATSS